MRQFNNQKGIALVGELLIAAVVIAVIAVVAIKVTGSHAATRCTRFAGRPFCYNIPTTSSSTSTSNSGSSATCTVNGVTTYSASGSCSSSTGTSSHSTSTSPGTPGVNNTTVIQQNGAAGASGKSSCTVNGEAVAC